MLEHLVDCVLSFEGERERTYRTLRALKNRFGSTNEVGVFEMVEQGLVEVEDASERFVTEATRAPGSVVLCAMEGSRPLLVEVQALVAPTELVPPRRVANGVDRNRLALVLAVLARHGGVGLGTSDVFVSVAGGVRVDEPGADLRSRWRWPRRRRASSSRRTSRWRPSASSGSPASSGTSPTPTAAWPRRPSSGSTPSSAPGQGATTLREALRRAPQRPARPAKTAAQSQNERMSKAFPVESGRCRMPGMT